ncbi:MAG: hypothetical protein IJU79_01525 [Desulfovibrionaceae bacterium]|nr:hypothetical protein [Desulfovibrionaceae bacterium]
MSKSLFILSCLLLLAISWPQNALTASKRPMQKHLDNTSIEKIPCDGVTKANLRLGLDHNFTLNFNSKESKIQISDINFWFHSDVDYTGKGQAINFHPTKEFDAAHWEMDHNSLELLESDEYTILNPPKQRSDKNITIKYEIIFNEYEQDGKLNPKQEKYFQCGHYAVTRCGDGVVDTEFQEECDPGLDGSANSCSKDCKKIKN